MKLQTYQAFKQHIKQHFSDTDDHLFAVLGMDFYEREVIIKEVLSSFKGATIVYVDALESNFPSLRSELEVGDLFSDKKVVVLKSIEKASKAFLKDLAAYLETASCYSLILDGEKLEKSFYDKVTKQLVALDLTKEKPWDRKARIISWLGFFVKRDGKTLAPELADTLYESSEKQLSIMLQELNKLICYTKGSQNISLSDYRAVSSSQSEEKLWNLSEGIVFRNDQKSFDEAVCKKLDAQTFHQLLAQLRYHLQIAAKMQALVLSGDTAAMSHFPRLMPKTFDKYQRALARMPSEYAKDALRALFDAEAKAKSIAVDENVLFLELLTKMQISATLRR
ncbi:MAG: hypothetical protein S4CHLAM37_14540 [Chlamydiia bacterium]|nr:hypothetical protein [Chlamydiia bacterium]